MSTESGVEGKRNTPSHYLVAVSGSGNSEYLIRWTHAAARRESAHWTALHIKLPGTESDPVRLDRNLTLARRLGAEVLSTPGTDIATTLIRYARIKGADRLVLGKTGPLGPSFRGRRGVTEEVLRESGELDVICLRGDDPGPLRRRPFFELFLPSHPRDIAVAFIMIGAVTLVSLAILPAVGYKSVALFYLLAIISLSFFSSRVAILLGALLGALAWDFLFIPPRMTITVGSLEDVLMLASYFLSAAACGFLVSRLRAKEAALAIREERSALLYGFSRELTRTRGEERIALLGLSQVSLRSGADAAIVHAGVDGRLDYSRAYGDVSIIEKVVAERCLSENLETMDEERSRYYPLSSSDSVFGVLIVRATLGLQGEDRELLATLAGNLGLALERESLQREVEERQMAEESERLSRTLLNHVSHELRTPLTTIKGSTSALLDGVGSDDPEVRRELLLSAQSGADKLDALVADLLAMSRLESGVLRPRLRPTDVAELLGPAREAFASEISGRSIVVAASCSGVEFQADPVLIAQVFRNILRNFIAYTPAGSTLRVSAEDGPDAVTIRFQDDGPGVAVEETSQLLEKFYRGTNSLRVGGTGLGLSICKGIVEAHGGSISVETGKGEGFTVHVRLPKPTGRLA
jgi:two-component system sensor histidine kinase KdpD